MTAISWSELFTSFFILFGLFFILTGSLGLLRFPDVYSRLHAPTKSATLGVIGILIASIIHLGYTTGSWGVKEILITVFLFLTAPVGAHMMGRAAYLTGVPLSEKVVTDEYANSGKREEAGTKDADHTLQS